MSTSTIRDFGLAVVTIAVTVATGLAWLGQPLRLVQLVTLIGLAMTAGVSWTQAVWRARDRQPRRPSHLS